MHSVKVEENIASAPDRATTQIVFVFELKGTLTFTLEDGRKEKVSLPRVVLLSRSDSAIVWADRRCLTAASFHHLKFGPRLKVTLSPAEGVRLQEALKARGVVSQKSSLASVGRHF